MKEKNNCIQTLSRCFPIKKNISDLENILHPLDISDYWTQDFGVLLLHDPRFNASLMDLSTRNNIKIFPSPGLMILFPGYLWHSVTPHKDVFNRLAISANFILKEGNNFVETFEISV